MYTIYFKPFPTIETERLILRKVKKTDVSDLYEYCKSPISAKYADWEPHEDISVTKQYVAWLLNSEKHSKYFTWCIEEKESGKVIGTCSFTSMDKDFKIAEIGYGILNNYWGNGYATEAVGAIMDYGFCTVGLVRIFARIIKGNIASVKVAKKLNMECEGFLRKGAWCKGKGKDIYIYAITDDKYKKYLPEEEEIPEDAIEEQEISEN